MYRFLGTTEGSTSARALLQSLCTQIKEIKGDKKELPSSYQKLSAHFSSFLESTDNLIIFLDSLDQVLRKGNILLPEFEDH